MTASVAFVRRPSYRDTARAAPASETLPVSGLRTNHRVAGGGTEQRFLALSQSWRLGFLGRENVLI